MKFQFSRYKDWIYILPTIVLVRNEPMYYAKNFAIQIHWLGFHIRWLWVDKEY